MPRSQEEKRRRAQKYGRRHRLGMAMKSRRELDAVVADLQKELRSSTVPRDTVQELIKGLRQATDDRRRHAAIWALVAALEAAESRR